MTTQQVFFCAQTIVTHQYYHRYVLNVFQSGVNTNLPNGGIYIRSLVPGGAAERDGHIHAGITAKYQQYLTMPFLVDLWPYMYYSDVI